MPPSRGPYGAEYRWCCRLGGTAPILLLGSDFFIAARLPPAEIQVGIVTRSSAPVLVALGAGQLASCDPMRSPRESCHTYPLRCCSSSRSHSGTSRSRFPSRSWPAFRDLRARESRPDSSSQLRLPRALTAVLVGGAFGFSGAIFQSLARNPLASPDIIGITAGASAAAVFVIVVLHGSGLMVSVGALVGALTAAMAIYVLAYQRGTSPYRLVLVGIGIGSVLGSITSYLFTRAEIFDAQRAAVWLTGSLNSRSWEHVRPVGFAMAVLFPAVLVLARPLRAMQLGDDTAKGLGVRVERCRVALVVVGVSLAAVATGPAADASWRFARLLSRDDLSRPLTSYQLRCRSVVARCRIWSRGVVRTVELRRRRHVAIGGPSLICSALRHKIGSVFDA